MRTPTHHLLAPALVLLLAASAQAQTAQPAPDAPAQQQDTAAAGSATAEAAGKYNQKAQNIRVEDAGSRIDEVRVGGQTQSIHVQPKVGNMPAYEVKSTDGARNRPDGFGESQTKKRVWNIGNF